MKEYHKINTIYKRDMQDKKKLVVGEWSTPEFEFLQNNRWEFTEKVDGTNIRVHIRRVGDSVWVEYGGRTDKAEIPLHLLERLEETFPTAPMYRRSLERPGFSTRHHTLLAWMLEKGLTNVVLYGEGYGPKIQGGEKYRDNVDFVLFDVQVGEHWLTRDNVNDVAANLGIDSVPVIGYGSLHQAVALVKGNGLPSLLGNTQSEGLVVRPEVPLFDRKGERIIAKIKTRDFT